MQKSLFEITEKFLNKHFLPISITLLVHLLILNILVLIDIKSTSEKSIQEIIVEIEDLKEEYDRLIQKVEDSKVLQNGEEEALKNIAKNLAENNKSFDDYYNEAKKLLEHSKHLESFKPGEYSDKRVLIKDYSLETPDIKDWDKPIDSIITKVDVSNKTYSGNTVIGYDLGGRKSKKLKIPAYKCLGSGSITVEIMVTRKGEVKEARIVAMSSTLNETCIPESAIEAALNSLFFADYNAPELQKGYIFYQFVKQ
ncbi:MAG: hypothetical protein N3A01_05720 [Bacteroidales bacterium]|nr:hypothetical protein [Bacteroidales bacterium]